MREALLYNKRDDRYVRCFTCAHRCLIAPEHRGMCGVRYNREGTLYVLNYGKLIARHIDPIEKKPLFHVLPGSTSYSIAAVGCNFRCLFCQNADISQLPGETTVIYGREVDPAEVVHDAHRYACRSISYTYTEPTIFLEYALDVMRGARERSIANVFVSNGFMSQESCDAVIPLLDAVNVDLKSFRDDFYRKVCGGKLDPVLKTLRRYKEKGVWVEVTTLIIPGLNDDPGELRDIAEFIVSLGSETPWHVTRFHPAYRLVDRPVTPVATLVKAREIGLKAGLQFVYTGNVPGEQGESTYCPSCHALLVERVGFSSSIVHLRGVQCGSCGREIAGIWTL